MSKARFEIKVGLFVFGGLVLLGLLLLQFSKGASIFKPTYELVLMTPNVGALKERAMVLMAGVEVGTVSDITLTPSGTNVAITLKLYEKYVIRKDARFVIDQSGFLGDTYIGIDPGLNAGEPFAPGEHAYAEAPFNLQEVARTASGFIQRLDDTAKKLNEAMTDIRQFVLNETNLANLGVAIERMRGASERAVVLIDEINTLFVTNSPAVYASASNLALASSELNRFSTTLNNMLTTNGHSIASAVENIETSTETLKSLLADVQAGKGPAGTILRDEKVASDMAAIFQNLSITTSNLNRRGLWGILWKQKQPKQTPERESDTERVESPKHSQP